MNRCTGHCCKDFTLPLSPMELSHRAKRIQLGDNRFHPEQVQVANMVIFLGQHPSGTNRRSVKKIKGSKQTWHISTFHYTCKHFDPETRNCTNYESRPNMCRTYPDGGTCTYRDCTLKKQAIVETTIKDEEKMKKVET